jgi:Xaa-Pro dipeptidase
MIDPRAYRRRQRRLAERLSKDRIRAAVLVDQEGLRNRSVRYLCGQPGDALLFLFTEGDSLLVPWDVPLARGLATADELIPYERYDRSLLSCIKSIVKERRVEIMELPAALPYPLVRTLIDSLPETEFLCRWGGIEEFVDDLRMIKDVEELKLIDKACGITNELIDAAAGLLAGRREVTEMELAMFLETEARRRGAEGMGFDTLAASARRSFAIHCVPSFTTEPIATQGLSILDFGVCYAGYTSDVTLTLARAPLSSRQKIMVEAVQVAYDLAVQLCVAGTDPVSIDERVQEHFDGLGFRMPHSLGHGIGLDAHEEPSFRRQGSITGEENRRQLQPGMVFTIEPGLYDPEAGGVRLENDLLCTKKGADVLTSARIIEL